MPAGTDLIIWNPRVGDTGDDRYDPGDVPLRLGDRSGYSSWPTLDEVNAGSGLYQIEAEIRRRLPPTGYFSFTTQPSPLSDFTGLRVKASDILWKVSVGLIDYITNIRQQEAKAAYSWTTSPAAGLKLDRQRVLEMRKALATDYIAGFLYNDSSWNGQYLQKTGSSWPPSTVSLAGAGVYGLAGRTKVSGTSWRQSRIPLFFLLPDGIPTLDSAYLDFSYAKNGGVVDGSTLALYKANSYFAPLDTGDWSNADSSRFSGAESSLYTVDPSVKRNSIAFSSFSELVSNAQLAYMLIDTQESSMPTGANDMQIILKGAAVEPGTPWGAYQSEVGCLLIRMYTA